MTTCQFQVSAAAIGRHPEVSTTVVKARPALAATIRSSRSNASAEAAWSYGPLPTTPRSWSEETISTCR